MFKPGAEKFFIYIHVYSNGELFLLDTERAKGETIGVDDLADLIDNVNQQRGIIYYSIEDSNDSLSSMAEEILRIISGTTCQHQLVEPHPQAYGYDRSFIPHLNEALEAALIDVQGLERDFAEIEQLLSSLEPEEPEYLTRLREKKSILKRLDEAQSALNKILHLHFDLCVEPDGMEQ